MRALYTANAYLGDGFSGDAHLDVFLNCLVAVLRVMHPDARRNALHVGSLLLVPDLVDGVQKPGLPGGSRFFLRHL